MLIEAVLPRDDAPELLTALAGRFAEQNDYGDRAFTATERLRRLSDRRHAASRRVSGRQW
ncbi:hypothetical protein ACH4VR_02630 [Streptomyces sp. NPDC020883]|uniref:hypothetical protein n=1 Tax=Streptomyces sp. NPDC020883 TaxID=3365099 RepID=UPI0037AFFD78